MGIYLVYKIGDKEFKVKFQKEIEDWLTHQDQKRFERMISRMIRAEMNKFHITDKDIEDIVKQMIKKPTFTITVVEAIK